MSSMIAAIDLNGVSIPAQDIVAWRRLSSSHKRGGYDVVIYTTARAISAHLDDEQWYTLHEQLSTLLDRTFISESLRARGRWGELLLLGHPDNDASDPPHLSQRLRALRNELARLKLPTAQRFIGFHPPGFVTVRVPSTLGEQEGALLVTTTEQRARFDLLGSVYDIEWTDLGPADLAALVFAAASDQLCNAHWLEISALVLVAPTAALTATDPIAHTIVLSDDVEGIRALHGTKDRRLTAAEKDWMKARYQDDRPLKIPI